MVDYKKYIGQTFKFLTITNIVKHHKKTYAVCDCLCGNKSKSILISYILNGHTTSCGCRSKVGLFTKNTKRPILNDFSVMSPEVCYWAGFIFGDGSVDIKHKLQIGLASDCYEHLVKFSMFLCGQNYVGQYKTHCHFQITDEVLIKNFQKFGIIPNKTYIQSLKIPTEYTKDFIRGYFDADGWFSMGRELNKKYNRYYPRYCFGLCSFLEQNLIEINDHLPIKFNFCHKPRLHEIRSGSTHNIYTTVKFLEPEHKELCLSKKWNKIWDFIKHYEKDLMKTK